MRTVNDAVAGPRVHAVGVKDTNRHDKQLTHPVAPALFVVLPLGHGVQFADPGDAEKKSMGHSWHCNASPDLKVPAGQEVHGQGFPSGAKYPFAHRLQLVEPWELHVPTGQLGQGHAVRLPDEKVPAAQEEQLLIPVWEQVAAGHC